MLLIKILLGLLGLSILITAHELGHFIAAKFFGVKVQTFSIGFGKKLFTIKGKETEFALSLIPLGGYCKFNGEKNFIQAWENNIDHIPQEPGTFFGATPWKRIIISIAGPLANIISALLLLLLISGIPYPVEPIAPRIILASSYNDQLYPADEQGLKNGDLILTIDSQPIDYFKEVELSILKSPEKLMVWTVLRGDEILLLNITPSLNRSTGGGQLGIYPLITSNISDPIYLDDEIQVPKNSRLVGLNDYPISYLTDVFPISSDLTGEIIATFIGPEGVSYQLELEDLDSFWEIYPWPIYQEFQQVSSVKEALGRTWDQFSEYIELTLKGFSMLFRGIEVNKAIIGPLRVPLFAGETAISGMEYGLHESIRSFIQFLAPLSLGLALVNLLPLPVLDGGQIILFLIEIVIRRPLKTKFVVQYQMIGTIAILLLIGLSLSVDLLYFFRS